MYSFLDIFLMVRQVLVISLEIWRSKRGRKTCRWCLYHINKYIFVKKCNRFGSFVLGWRLFFGGQANCVSPNTLCTSINWAEVTDTIVLCLFSSLHVCLHTFHRFMTNIEASRKRSACFNDSVNTFTNGTPPKLEKTGTSCHQFDFLSNHKWRGKCMRFRMQIIIHNLLVVMQMCPFLGRITDR